MKKLLLFAFLMMMHGADCFSQLTFQKTFGGASTELGSVVIQTTDGGYFIAGATNSFGAGNFDGYAIKANADGDMLWSKTFGGAGDDRFYDAALTSDGGFILVGWTSSFGIGNGDFYLIKLNANGDTLWTKTYDNGDATNAMSVQQTDDGGYILAGETIIPNETAFRVCIIKTGSNGDIVWDKIFGHPTYSSAATCVRQTSDGGYIVGGISPGSSASLIRLNSSGDSLWSRVYGSTFNDRTEDVKQTSDGGFILAGSYDVVPNSNSDAYLIRTDSNGDTLWTRTVGGNGWESATSVLETSDNGYLAVGYTYSYGPGSQGIFLIKTNSAGVVLWTRTFGGAMNQSASCIRKTNDQGYIICGGTSSFGVGGSDIYLIKLDSMGNSGCYENIPPMESDIPSTGVSTIFGSVSSGMFSAGTATILSSGGMQTTNCSTNISAITNSNSDFDFYPNPFYSGLKIKSKDVGEVILYDITGKETLRQKVIEGETMLNTEFLAEGFYVLSFSSANQVENFKIIKE